MEALTKLVRDLAVLAAVALTAFWCGQSATGKPADAAGVSENADMIAVTGEFGSGTSVLYLIDTRGKTLLVYESRGGSQQDLKLVAARDIAYDLKLRSYNDKSDSGMSVDDLERRWRKFVGDRGAGQGAKMRPGKSQASRKSGNGTKTGGALPPEDGGNKSSKPTPVKGSADPKKEPTPSR